MFFHRPLNILRDDNLIDNAASIARLAQVSLDYAISGLTSGS